MAKNIVYPGIAKWLAKNNMTIEALNKKARLNSFAHLWNILNGVIDPRKKTIDKILAATGLTYEEAFGNAEDVKADE